MAVAIPDKRKLGPLPGLASTPMVSAPRDYTAAAVQNLGQAVQGLGKQVAIEQYDQNQTIQKAQVFEVASATDRFESEQRIKANEHVLNMQPGAPGLADSFSTGYQKSAADFIATQPEWLRPKLQAQLTGTETRLRESLLDKQNKEANRYALEQFDTDEARRVGEAAGSDDPAVVTATMEKSKAFIAANPHLTPVQKEAMLRETQDRFAKGYADRLQSDPARAKAVFAGAGNAAQGVSTDGQRAPSEDMPNGPPGSGGRARARSAIDRGANIKSYYETAHGLSPVQAAAVGGHAIQESGGQASGRVGDGGTAFGTFQWRNERFTALKRFANERGADWKDQKTQLDYAAWEGENGDAGARRAWKELKSATTVEEATKAWMHFERPQGYTPDNPSGGHGYAARLSNARSLLGAKGGGELDASSGGGAAAAQPVDRFATARTHYASLFPEARPETLNTLAERAVRGASQFDQEKRIGIADAMENAPAALQQSGMYTGYMPSRQDFSDAYGIQGETKFEEFQTTNETAKTVFDMQTMPNAEIQRTVEASQPTSTGEGAALEGKRSEAIQKAAASVLKARAADPSGYVMSAVPAVKQVWEGVEVGTPEYARAIRTTTEAQLALGIPATQVQPLPAAMAKSAVTMFKDETQAPEARLGSVVQSVFATKDEDQQQAIFRQLVKEGAPPEISAVLGAVKRGEPDAAQRLFTAMVSDPSKLPGVIRDKDALIDQQIETDLMAENQIGDIIYNLSSGSPDAQAKAQRDAPLIKKSVQLYVRDGKSLPDAVAATRRDLWGDVKLYPGQWGVNAMAVIPSSVDDAVLSHGIRNTVPSALRSVLQARAESRIATIDPKDIGVRNVTKQIAERAIDDVLDTSRIISLAPGRLGVSDERTGETYKNPDGKELSWTIEELLAAGKTAPTAAPLTRDKWDGVWGGVAP